METLKALLKQPYWVIALVLGVLLVALPVVSIGKDYQFSTHPPTTRVPETAGLILLALSACAFGFTLWTKYAADKEAAAGLDLRRVIEKNGLMCTTISGCEICVSYGRIQDWTPEPGAVIVLPCNEYFDDQCAGDKASALGAYANAKFEGQIDDFIALVKHEAMSKLGVGELRRKTDREEAKSFGPGQCLLLVSPLNRSVRIALVSTTTQRAGQGLSAQIRFLFDGMRKLFATLADARLTEVVMPVLGAGHGRIDPSLALVGLLLAVAEAARHGQGGQRLRKVTIVVFKRDEKSSGEVPEVVVRRALALIGSRD